MLSQYEKERLPANIALMGIIHSFQRLYSNDWSPLVFARGFGMSLVENLPWLKKEIMHVAMGPTQSPLKHQQ